jgi:hypothetical protein
MLVLERPTTSSSSSATGAGVGRFGIGPSARGPRSATLPRGRALKKTCLGRTAVLTILVVLRFLLVVVAGFSLLGRHGFVQGSLAFPLLA